MKRHRKEIIGGVKAGNLANVQIPACPPLLPRPVVARRSPTRGGRAGNCKERKPLRRRGSRPSRPGERESKPPTRPRKPGRVDTVRGCPNACSAACYERR